MLNCLRPAAALFLLCALGTVRAQPAGVAPPPVLSSLPAPAAASAPAQSKARLEPLSAASAASAARPAQTVQKTVIEDDAVRIEETRLRGQPQRITVRSKLPGARPYEIIVAPGGQDSSQDRGAAGKRAWSVFDF
jgi:hypothetical protein